MVSNERIVRRSCRQVADHPREDYLQQSFCSLTFALQFGRQTLCKEWYDGHVDQRHACRDEERDIRSTKEEGHTHVACRLFWDALLDLTAGWPTSSLAVGAWPSILAVPGDPTFSLLDAFSSGGLPLAMIEHCCVGSRMVKDL